RIALELYHKRLLVGGIDRLFEIGKNFRNEGLSRRHNPEFTMLEAYCAFGDYDSMMETVQSLITTIAQKVLGTSRILYQHPKEVRAQIDILVHGFQEDRRQIELSPELRPLLVPVLDSLLNQLGLCAEESATRSGQAALKTC